MHCPRCDQPSLHRRVRAGQSLEVCVFCQGVWLEAEAFEALFEPHPEDDLSPGLQSDDFDEPPRGVLTGA